MKGKYHIIVQNSRIKFEFDIKRNITIVRGDSGTGKTTLMEMVETYERLGEESGVSVSCEKPLRTLNNSNWETVVSQSEESIIFVDEETKVITTREFAEGIRGSRHYYVIITRENLPNLPYSVEEVYGIHNAGKYADIRQSYNSFYRLYREGDDKEPVLADIVVTEDSNAGYEFFRQVASKGIACIPAGGNTKIRRLMEEYKGKKVLVIADGAAFGSEMGELYRYICLHPEVSVYLPESFEWIILSSGLIDGNRVLDIAENTEDYAESTEFFSWEQFYTRLLVDETKDSYLQYNKSKLNPNYLHDREKNALLKVIKVIEHRLIDPADRISYDSPPTPS